MKQELINTINQKERELNNLNSQLDDLKANEKDTILKSSGFDKIRLYGENGYICISAHVRLEGGKQRRNRYHPVAIQYFG